MNYVPAILCVVALAGALLFFVLRARKRKAVDPSLGRVPPVDRDPDPKRDIR